MVFGCSREGCSLATWPVVRTNTQQPQQQQGPWVAPPCTNQHLMKKHISRESHSSTWRFLDSRRRSLTGGDAGRAGRMVFACPTNSAARHCCRGFARARDSRVTAAHLDDVRQELGETRRRLFVRRSRAAQPFYSRRALITPPRAHPTLTLL